MSSAVRASPRWRGRARAAPPRPCARSSARETCSAAAVAAASRCSSSSRESAASASSSWARSTSSCADARGDALELLADAGEVLLLLEEGELLLAAVPVEGLQRRLELEQARLQGAVPLVRERELGLERADDVLELLHLAPPLQRAVPLALERPAGDDAVRVEHLAVERDQRALPALLLPDLERGGEVADDERVAEQEADDLLVGRVEADHVEAGRDDARGGRRSAASPPSPAPRRRAIGMSEARPSAAVLR